MNEAKNLTFPEIEIGQKASFQVQISNDMVKKFAELSGDYNPIHMDDGYAKQSKFQKRIVHGMLLASFISQLVGMHLPGKKCLYLSQNLNFHNPCFISDTISIKGIVKEKSNATKILEIETSIHNQNEVLLLNGTARVMVI